MNGRALLVQTLTAKYKKCTYEAVSSFRGKCMLPSNPGSDFVWASMRDHRLDANATGLSFKSMLPIFLSWLSTALVVVGWTSFLLGVLKSHIFRTNHFCKALDYSILRTLQKQA
jgi:hypothetical protein